MDTPARTFTVESTEPGFGASPKRHVVLTARVGEGVDVLNLWTADPDLAAQLVPGARFKVRVDASDRRTFVIHRDGRYRERWLATAPMTGAPIVWTSDEDDAAHFIGHAVALEDARLCMDAGHAVRIAFRG